MFLCSFFTFPMQKQLHASFQRSLFSAFDQIGEDDGVWRNDAAPLLKERNSVFDLERQGIQSQKAPPTVGVVGPVCGR